MIKKLLIASLIISSVIPMTVLAEGKPVVIRNTTLTSSELGEYFYATPGDDLQTSNLSLNVSARDESFKDPVVLSSLVYTCNVEKGIPLSAVGISEVQGANYIKRGSGHFFRRGKTIQARVTLNNSTAAKPDGADNNFSLIVKVKRNAAIQEFDCAVTKVTLKNTRTKKILPVASYDAYIDLWNKIIIEKSTDQENSPIRIQAK